MNESAFRNRFELAGLAPETRRDRFARDVVRGLTSSPKHLSCCYFYDALGSKLFEAICELPEYYLTRAETAILEAHAGDIAARFPAGVDLVELGSGNAAKTRLLIAACLRRHDGLQYVPIDICRTVLEESSAALLRDFSGLRIKAIAGEYEESLEHWQKETSRPKVILWLGSNIGNLHREQAARFLRRVGKTMSIQDRLLVGIDLRKDQSTLEAAYDDATGVTAAFNKNILARINRELRANFDLKAFEHRAVYDVEAGRIEMYLQSSRPQVVQLEAIKYEVMMSFDLGFQEGEMIHTENSYKYSPAEIDELARTAGLGTQARWLDPEERFCLSLFGIA
jgi:dimethylhistidine N-methyltransferase